jgi:hypothetical protein
LGEARSELDRLLELAERIEGELAAQLAEHCGALATGSGQPLELAAHRFAGLGVDLLAAEPRSARRRLSR